MKINGRFGSLFSGIGGFDLGLERAGWKCEWQVENDKFCNEILGRHWPEVPRYGDISAVDFSGLDRVDLVCGGFPCQDVSVAGQRAGLAGERSGLFWKAIECIRILEPRWVLIENVPGLFSSQSGRDFAQVISALDELRYGVAWRVLDSQNFGVAQRRRRVFIVGYLGEPCPPEILFEPESLSRDTQAGKEAGKDFARAIATGTNAHRYDWETETFATIATLQASGAETSRPAGMGSEPDFLVAGTVTQRSGAHTGNSNPIAENLVTGAPTDADRVRNSTRLSAGLDSERRAEPDSPRYKALGNAVTVNVAEWIGRRILSENNR